MGHTLLSVLGFFFLNLLLYCGHAQDAVLTFEPNWSTFFTGESLTLICDMREGKETDWHYTFRKDGREFLPYDTKKKYTLQSLHTGDSGEYQCFGRHKTKHYSSEGRNKVSLIVSANRPNANLSTDDRTSPAGGTVTLTCSVIPPSSGWTYFWYRGDKTSEPLTKQDAVFISSDKILVSAGGLYWCRGGRGNPVYYTEYSDAVVIVTNRAVVNLRPDWPEIYKGDTITLTCEIEDGGDTEWEYEWSLPSSHTPPKHKEYKITSASSSHTGDYRCQGKMRNGQSTQWSEAFRLKLSYNPPHLVLTVSPLWLNPGDSVTLNCEVKHPSAGWRFYFYKAVPNQSQTSYSFELLPGSSNGTEQDSYIVHGQSHTAAYLCRAGRGYPVYLTSYSGLKFVWSGDFHSAASLTVNPDRVQHFIQESASLNCKGNSTKWRVREFSESGYLLTCSYWGTAMESTCNIRRSISTNRVFWCESETGHFSNAVNISKTNTDVILVSPVHPVVEGDSVTLVCKFETEKVSSIVHFYKNSKLIQNDSRRELMIPAVSKSDEGFYKCKGKDLRQVSYTSSQSWLSVKSCVQCTETDPKNFQRVALWIVGPVCGVFLIIFLLLFLCYCTRSKDSCFCESMKFPEAVENDESSCVTYCFVELKEIAQKGKTIEPEEGAVYTDLRKESAADTTLMYVQVCSYDEVNGDKKTVVSKYQCII